jgi:hypothetical protein
MTLFPKAAWPALSYFAPDILTELEARFDKASPGSKEQKAVREEAQVFIKEFRKFAVTTLISAGQNDLERLCQGQKARQDLEDRYFAKACVEFLKVDVTVTELERMRRLYQQYAPPTKSLAQALKALNKSGSFRQ